MNNNKLGGEINQTPYILVIVAASLLAMIHIEYIWLLDPTPKQAIISIMMIFGSFLLTFAFISIVSARNKPPATIIAVLMAITAAPVILLDLYYMFFELPFRGYNLLLALFYLMLAIGNGYNYYTGKNLEKLIFTLSFIILTVSGLTNFYGVNVTLLQHDDYESFIRVLTITNQLSLICFLFVIGAAFSTIFKPVNDR